MNIPKNCSECPNTNTCAAPHYGGFRCQYKEAICSKTIKEVLTAKPKD